MYAGSSLMPLPCLIPLPCLMPLPRLMPFALAGRCPRAERLDRRPDGPVLRGMRLEFAGSRDVGAPREVVWQRLIDPHFVAKSALGIESVETVDQTHFRLISAFGIGAMKLRVALDGEMFDLADERSAKLRARGKAPGSAIDVLSTIRLEDAGPGRTLLHWTAAGDLGGIIASLGTRLLEGAFRTLTEEFWADFARRVESA
jgi:carbon monoxide dehydrogenase subunit G